MKLDHGNPNLMKKAATRVNPHSSSLSSFVSTSGSKEQAKYRTGFVPSVKDPNAVPAPAMNLWEYPVYVSPKNEYMRPGADDHLKFKSVGNLT